MSRTGTVTALRISAWNADASARLADREGRLPSITLPDGTRSEPPAIVEALRCRLGLDAVLVRVAPDGLVDVEVTNAAVPAGLTWCSGRPDPPLEQRHLWHRPGWFGRMLDTIDRVLPGAGLTRTGVPVQTRHTSVTAMLRIPTDRYPVWLKFVAPIFDVERSLVTWLGTVLPGQVPEIVAHGPGWWISAPFPAPVPAPRADFLAEIVRLQMATAGRLDELRGLGCPDRPVDGLVAELERAADHPTLLDRDHQKMLRASLRPLDKVSAAVAALTIPSTLVHGDLTPDNLRWTGRDWFLYDWTDGCVSHPFVDLELALDAGPAQQRTARARAYASAWAGLGLAAQAHRALPYAPVIGAAHQVATYHWILDSIQAPGGDASGRAQLRYLLRHWTRRLAAALDRDLVTA
jgi:hypothetical protein